MLNYFVDCQNFYFVVFWCEALENSRVSRSRGLFCLYLLKFPEVGRRCLLGGVHGDMVCLLGGVHGGMVCFSGVVHGDMMFVGGCSW